MPPVASHSTGTSEGTWDGPANEARLRSGESRGYYARAYAWRDPEADDSTKAAYKFIHHEVATDGDPGAANLTGCSAGIAVLNGGRGGTTIPDADRQGVWNHLARHLRDGDREPPELKSDQRYRQRSWNLRDVRVASSEKGKIVDGYAAVFDSPTEIDTWFGRYRESIEPGAFTKTLKENDIRALYNHNPDWVLGRNKAGTLDLREDDHGLAVTIKLPDTSYASDLAESLKRGDIDQMSFGFEIIRDRWIFTKNDAELDERTLLEVRLWDVSPVTFPAYPQTEAHLRTAITALQRQLQPEPERPRRHSGRSHESEPSRHHSQEQLRQRIAVMRAAVI
jgi:HK97 family phage prohead protease